MSRGSQDDEKMHGMFSTNVVFPTESQTGLVQETNENRLPNPSDLLIKFPENAENRDDSDDNEHEHEHNRNNENEEEEEEADDEDNRIEINSQTAAADDNQDSVLEKEGERRADTLLGGTSPNSPKQSQRRNQNYNNNGNSNGNNQQQKPRTATITAQQRQQQRRRESGNPPPDSETVTTMTTKFLKGEKVTANDPELLASVVMSLEDQRDELMIEGSFVESMKAQKAVDAAKAQQLDAVKKQTQNEQQENIQQKKKNVEEEYEMFRKDMKEKEEELERSIDKQIEGMKERHQDELSEHDSEWQSENKFRQFNRSSQRLRVLRTQQQLLMNAKRFEEAAQVCKIADGVAAKETQESHRQMLLAFKNSRSKLEDKQREELDTLMKASEVRRGEFKYLKDNMEKPYLNRKKNLEIEEKIAEDPERLWVLKHRNDGDQITQYAVTSRNVKPNMTKKTNVAEFNTLPLPPLPVPTQSGSPRKTTAVGNAQ